MGWFSCSLINDSRLVWMTFKLHVSRTNRFAKDIVNVAEGGRSWSLQEIQIQWWQFNNRRLMYICWNLSRVAGGVSMTVLPFSKGSIRSLGRSNLFSKFTLEFLIIRLLAGIMKLSNIEKLVFVNFIVPIYSSCSSARKVCVLLV